SSLLIDANVILEFFLAQQYQDECLALLKLTSNGSVTAFVMSYAVHSIEYILYREGNLIALRTFLELLQSSLGLTIYESSSSEDLAALAFTKKADAQFQLDFDDALGNHFFFLAGLPGKDPSWLLSFFLPSWRLSLRISPVRYHTKEKVSTRP